MYSRILVPLDGSKLSESVLPYSRALAKALRVPVELLRAVDPDVVSTFVNPAEGRFLDVMESTMKRDSAEYLESVAGSFPDPSAVTCSPEIDTPADAIMTRAAADSHALIAMATHGRSEVGRWFLGSITHKVLLTTTNPLLLVRPSEKVETLGVASVKKMIVPLDGSTLAERVLPHVDALAKAMNLDVILLRAYALPAATYYASEAYVPDWATLTEQASESAQQYLDQVRRRLQETGLSSVSTLVMEGDAAKNIIEIAHESEHSLVALCSHGRSGMARLILGSVADRVVRQSRDPVLVIRAQATNA